MMSMAGKTAIITGAGGAIGLETALALGRAGARLMLVDVAEELLEKSVAAVREAGAEAESCVADVSRSEDVQAYVRAARERLGSIDAFFNNAGIEGPVAHIVDYPDDAFDKVIAVNLRGVFLGLKHVMAVMIAQGHGSIVNTGSIASERGLPGTCAYNAAKHAVLGLTRTAAVEAGPHGIRINAVMPGMIETQMLRRLAGEIHPGDVADGLRELGKVAPLQRCGQPQEIAAVVAFLLSDAAAFVNGAAWAIDGGTLSGIATGA